MNTGPVPADELDGILVLEATLDECQSNEDRCAPEPGHAVHGHTAARVLVKACLQ